MAYYYNAEFLDQYIGKGLSTTNTFDRVKLSTNVITGIDKIQDSIYNILSTKVGERLFLPEFGSRLHTVIFEPNNAIFADLADFYIRDALGKWERRIEVTDVSILTEQEGNIVPIEISYRITNSNIYDTYVYPFNKTIYGEPEIYEQGDITADYY